MKEFKVYSDAVGGFYSDGVTRVFGVNRMIRTKDFGEVFSSVQPLMCEPDECGLVEVGVIVGAS